MEEGLDYLDYLKNISGSYIIIKYFNFWSMCYKNSWVTLDMVKQAVSKSIVTADEFKTITGQDYTAQ